MSLRGAACIAGIGTAGCGSAPGRTATELMAEVGAGGDRGCRARTGRHRRAVRGHQHPRLSDAVDGGVSRPAPARAGRDQYRRIELRGPSAERHDGAGCRPVRRRADLLRLQPAHRWRPAGLDEREAGARGPLPAAPSDHRLCVGGEPAHAPVRDHPRAARRGRRRGAGLGEPQPGRVRAWSAHDRGRARQPHDQRPADASRIAAW